MPKPKTSLIQWLAWFYCANFLAIVTISHWPGLTDANGELMGLFAIDPIDDIFHLLSGLVGGLCAWRSRAWAVNYFKYAGIPYAIDAFTGIVFDVQFLNGDICYGVNPSDLSTRNILNNTPHIAIPVTIMLIGFVLAKVTSPKTTDVA